MKKCKFCQAELAENGTFCPSCGKDNAEPQVEQTPAAEPQETETQPVCAEAPVEETAAEETAVEEAAGEAPAAEETPAEAPAKKSAAKVILAVVAVVLVAAMLFALVMTGMGGRKDAGEVPETTAAPVETVPSTVPADGDPGNVTCKGTYTVEDAAAEADLNTVVAKIGGHTLTNSQLRIYYRSAMSTFLNTEYGYYMMMYGLLDLSKPLDTQLSYEDNTMTWQQFFLKSALENWQLTQAMAIEAENSGITMTEEDQKYLEELETSIQDMAASNNMTVEDMLKTDFGAGVDFAAFDAYQRLYYTGNPFYEAETEKLQPTDEELEAFFKEHEETYASGGVTMDSRCVDVRHILVQVEGGTAGEDGTTTYSEEEWKTCEAEAQAILDTWLAGEKTEDSFAALANEKSEDPGSNTKGGLYEKVQVGQMVEPFETWCFDESRQYGDTGLVQTSYGYHVMFYVGSEPLWKDYAKTDWTNEQISNMLETIVESYPMEVIYENITLGNVKLA